jgi:hypothetical protein
MPDTQNGDSRNVPISPEALELLEHLPRNIRGGHVVDPLHYAGAQKPLRGEPAQELVSLI